MLYKARLNSGALFAERDRLTLVMLDAQQANNFYEAKLNSQLSTDGHIDAAAYQMVFKNCQKASITGRKKEANHHNYFLGDDPSRWASQVPLFQELEYKNLYKDIDLLFYQQQHKLKYEFRLAPEANPLEIQIEYVGVNSLSLSNGNLLIKTDVGQITELAPYAYQLDESGKPIEIPCKFFLRKNTVSYELGNYNKHQPLIIDPQLIFSSYSGSSADNWGFTATYDKHGNLYGGGIAFGIGYPTQVGHHYQVDYAGGSCDIAISKFDSTGSQLFYSTYLGGNAAECPHSMFVNENNELYVYGTTSSTNFAVTPGAYDVTFNGGDSYTLTSTVIFENCSDIVKQQRRP